MVFGADLLEGFDGWVLAGVDFFCDSNFFFRLFNYLLWVVAFFVVCLGVRCVVWIVWEGVLDWWGLKLGCGLCFRNVKKMARCCFFALIG